MREGDVPIIRRSAQLERRAVISIVSVVELEGGVPIAREGARLRRAKLDGLFDVVEILPFNWADAQIYRRIVEQAGFSRRLIIDRMIAAQAIVVGATLATLNPRDFRDIPDLMIENWSR